MRLIDVNELLSVLLQEEVKMRSLIDESNNTTFDKGRIYELLLIRDIIKEQLTAYNVDKVIKEIKKIEVGDDCRHNCKHYDWSVGACQGICEDYVRNRAIEIVKRGINEHNNGRL